MLHSFENCIYSSSLVVLYAQWATSIVVKMPHVYSHATKLA